MWFRYTLTPIQTFQIHIFLALKATYTATVQSFNLAGAVAAGSKYSNETRCKGHKVQKWLHVSDVQLTECDVTKERN
jgi:hypothetical protein